jgi:hypothetical protein
LSPQKPPQSPATSGTGPLRHISEYLGRLSKLRRPQPKKQEKK